jgi:hypothetical protein
MKTLLRLIKGSQVYGTTVETSDTDYTSIYKLPLEDYLKLSFKEQIETTKDDVSIEVGRFLELLVKGSPIQIETIFTPRKYFLEYDPSIEILLENKQKFITKHLKHSYVGFAQKQLTKAQNITSRLDWEQNEVPRKTVLDFCYLVTEKGTVRIDKTDLDPNQLLVTKLNNSKEGHLVYKVPFKTDGLATDESNNLRVSETPLVKESWELLGTLLYNSDAYSSHCKKYKEYQDWLSKRNPERYKAIKETGSIVDLKFFYHTVRLLNTCVEIFTEGDIIVDRRGRDVDYLLKIRKGEIRLEELTEYVKDRLGLIEDLHSKSTLPEKVDMKFIEDLVVTLRR